MDIKLPARLEDYIQSRIATGRYADAAEVIEQALQLLDERDVELEAFQASVQEGFDQIKRGDYVVFDDEYEKTLFARAIALAESRRGPIADTKAS